jgi:hypothetical protein
MAIVARVAGAADGELDDHEVLDREAVLLQRRNLFAELANQRNDRGALQRDHAGVKRLIDDLARQVAAAANLLHVRQQLLTVAGIHHDHEVIIVVAIDNHIVLHAALLVAHKAVAALTGDHVVNLAGAQPLKELARVPPADLHAAHVAHVKQAPTLANLHVLIREPAAITGRAVIQRHVPPREIDHVGFVLRVEVEERSLVHGGR